MTESSQVGPWLGDGETRAWTMPFIGADQELRDGVDCDDRLAGAVADGVVRRTRMSVSGISRHDYGKQRDVDWFQAGPVRHAGLRAPRLRVWRWRPPLRHPRCREHQEPPLRLNLRFYFASGRVEKMT